MKMSIFVAIITALVLLLVGACASTEPVASDPVPVVTDQDVDGDDDADADDDADIDADEEEAETE